MIQKIQIRRGTAAQWTSANPILASGEQGLETDTRKTKMGDGSTAWNALAYASTGGPVGPFVQLSAAAYLLLTTEQQNNGNIYFITDES